MSGAGAAMARVHLEREQHSLAESQVAALAVLAERVRALNEVVVHTGAAEDELAAVSAEIAALTERLSADPRRPHPPIAQAGRDGIFRQLASPVTGPLNPIAPPLDVEILPDGTARAEFTLNGVYEGPPTFVHGGVSAMILDQLLGMAASANGTPGMTATLDLRYRRPTPYGVPLAAEAKATGADGRKSWCEGRVIDPEGRTTVEATAMFVMPRF
ncbi:PaaI family thioesterase [Spirillospora sp. NPDC029432]|uniref:PaaI family thioesterase n=1 Tax=Spirillospora sp. NPDC029432 TaxID=3154599 RepID=UPI003452E61C